MDNLRVSRFTIVKSLQYLLILLLWFLLTSPLLQSKLILMHTGDKRSASEESGKATRSVKSKKKEYEWLKRRTETPEKK